MMNLWLKQLADATLQSMIVKGHINDGSVLTIESDYPSDRIICTLDMRAVRQFMVEDNDNEAAETYKSKHQGLKWLFDALEHNIRYFVEWDYNNSLKLTPYKRTILTYDTSVLDITED